MKFRKRKQCRYVAVTAVLLLVLLMGKALGREDQARSAPPGDSRQVLDEIKTAASEITTLESDFIQERHMHMLENPLIAQGRFYFAKPNRLRWAVTKPKPSGFSVNGPKAKRWDGQADVVKNFEIQSHPFINMFVKQVMALTRADFKWLQKGYRLKVQNTNPVRLKLTPLKKAAQKHLAHLLVCFALDRRYVETIEIHEPDGDFTRIRFAPPEINRPISEDLF